MSKRKSKLETYESKGVIGHPMKHRQTGKDRLINQLNAWRAGKKVVLSVPDPLRRDGSHFKIPAEDWWGLPPCKKRRIIENESEDSE